jgi:hypothetical protein
MLNKNALLVKLQKGENELSVFPHCDVGIFAVGVYVDVHFTNFVFVDYSSISTTE